MTQNIITIAFLSVISVSAVYAENTVNRQISPLGGAAAIDYTYYDGVGRQSGASTNEFTLGLSYAPIRWLDLGVRSSFARTDYDDAELKNSEFIGPAFNSNRIELNATPFYGINDYFGVFGGVTIGQHFVSDANDFSYFALEPGVFIKPFGQDSMTQINLSYRYRDAFTDADAFETDAVRLNGEYAIDKVNSIFAGYEYVSGDQSYNAFSVGYKANF